MFACQGTPERPGRGKHFGFANLLALLRRTRQFQQRAPHQPFAPLDAAGGQRPLALARLQHLAHLGPRRTSIGLLRNEGPCHPRRGGGARVRPVLLRVP
ncbi:hypothetical protein ACLESD_42530, partial [Pyxidicoccus sp. 3LFB2]